MGAGGSTAASCSSLDFGGPTTTTTTTTSNGSQHRSYNFQQARHCQLQQPKYLNRKQLQLQQQQQQKSKPGQADKIMRHSSSYFDLTTQNCNSPSPYSTNHQRIFVNDEDEQMPTSEINNHRCLVGEQSAAEVYSLSNANFNVSRPIMVLPTSSNNNRHIIRQQKVCQKQQITNKSAGVAAKIHQQQQHKSAAVAHQLRKFSDSLPSLNHDRLMIVKRPPSVDYDGEPANHTDHASHGRHHNNQQSSSKQGVAVSRQNRPQSRVINLVNHNYHGRDSSTNRQLQQLASSGGGGGARMICGGMLNESSHESAGRFNCIKQVAREEQVGQMMKRAVSLSSFHDANVMACAQICQSKNRNSQNARREPRLAFLSSGDAKLHHSSRIEQQQQQLLRQRNNEDNCHSRACDLALERNCWPSSSANHVNMIQHRQLSAAAHSPVHYGGGAPLAKKILKLKQQQQQQQPNCSALDVKRRYTRQQQVKQREQGCPVLPPLPRSQSLHELTVQLRATENGQRMRNTGTLRGCQGQHEGASAAATSKVNLVVELLESRRRQRADEAEAEDKSCAAASQSNTFESRESSLDDGIVSSCGDQSSLTSRGDHNSSSSSTAANNNNNNKQRVFRKNNNSHLQSHSKRSSEHQVVNCAQRAGSQMSAKREMSPTHLRRSVSHSALNTEALLELVEAGAVNEQQRVDNDESDDLNELAKFLYQFKQRNSSSQTASSKSQARHTADAKVEARSQEVAQTTTTTTTTTTAVATGSSNKGNPQQSPNSTTSTSSGFASSSFSPADCSSSSSSSEEDTRRRKLMQPFPVAAAAAAKKKKYPAPARPDDDRSLICGQLKLSSSLLSIVDEYNNNTTSTGSKSNLASSLLSTNNDSYQVQKTYSKTSHEPERQLERLQLLAQSRKMSQSELALNQLCDAIVQQQQRAPEVNSLESRKSGPTKSKSGGGGKLFNLIRRISDKGGGSTAAIPPTSASISRDQLLARDKKSMQSDGKSGGHQQSHRTQPIINHQREHKCKSPPTVGQPLAANTSTINDDCSRLAAVRGAAANCYAEPTFSSSNNNNNNRYSNLSRSMANLGAFAASESVCDLNFDCDLELIKKCSTTAEQQQQQQQLQLQASKPSIHQVKPMMMQRQQVNESQQNNWRLVGGQQFKAEPSQSIDQRRQPKGKQKQKLTSSRSSSSAGEGTNASSKQKLSSKFYGGWLMRRTKNSPTASSKRSNNDEDSREPATHQRPDPVPLNGSSDEASQLLNEFDLTLEFERKRRPFNGQTTLEDSSDDDHHHNEETQTMNCGDGDDDDDDDYDDDDDDEEFEAHYASISRAMLDATLGNCDYHQSASMATPNEAEDRKGQLGSPSDSFTFSGGANLERQQLPHKQEALSSPSISNSSSSNNNNNNNKDKGTTTTTTTGDRDNDASFSREAQQQKRAAGKIISDGDECGTKREFQGYLEAKNGQVESGQSVSPALKLKFRQLSGFPEAALDDNGSQATAAAAACRQTESQDRKVERKLDGAVENYGSPSNRSKLITHHKDGQKSCRCSHCLASPVKPSAGGGCCRVTHHFAPQLELRRNNNHNNDDSNGATETPLGRSLSKDCCCQCNNTNNHSSSANNKPAKNLEAACEFAAAAAIKLGHQHHQKPQQQLIIAQRQLESDAARVHALMSGGFQRLVTQTNGNNLICRRSNSELDGSQRQAAILRQQQQVIMTKQPLFGRMRNSLLSRGRQDHEQTGASKQPIKLAANGHHYHGAAPLLLLSPLPVGEKLSSSRANSRKSGQPLVVAAAAAAPPGKLVIDPFDDNFILRRKTPNAGLKTRC